MKVWANISHCTQPGSFQINTSDQVLKSFNSIEEKAPGILAKLVSGNCLHFEVSYQWDP